MSLAILFHLLCAQHVSDIWWCSFCRLKPAKPTPPNTSRNKSSNTQRTENKTTDVVIHQHSRKLLKMDILMSETCWAHNKWNKIASDIKLVFHSFWLKSRSTETQAYCVFLYILFRKHTNFLQFAVACTASLPVTKAFTMFSSLSKFLEYRPIFFFPSVPVGRCTLFQSLFLLLDTDGVFLGFTQTIKLNAWRDGR